MQQRRRMRRSSSEQSTRGIRRGQMTPRTKTSRRGKPASPTCPAASKAVASAAPCSSYLLYVRRSQAHFLVSTVSSRQNNLLQINEHAKCLNCTVTNISDTTTKTHPHKPRHPAHAGQSHDAHNRATKIYEPMIHTRDNLITIHKINFQIVKPRRFN